MSLITNTVAEIYARQGFIEEATAIYEKILEREPNNAWAEFGLKFIHSKYQSHKAPNQEMLKCFEKGEMDKLSKWLLSWE